MADSVMIGRKVMKGTTTDEKYKYQWRTDDEVDALLDVSLE